MDQDSFKVTNDMLATHWQRIANLFIDYLAQLFIAVMIGFCAVFIDLLADTTLSFTIENMDKIDEYLLGFAILLVYYFTTECCTQRSLGKFVTGTIVITQNGEKPEVRTIFIRTLCRLIPFDFLSFLGNLPKGWHDTLSETRVVKKKIFLQRQSLSLEFDEIGKDSEVI